MIADECLMRAIERFGRPLLNGSGGRGAGQRCRRAGMKWRVERGSKNKPAGNPGDPGRSRRVCAGYQPPRPSIPGGPAGRAPSGLNGPFESSLRPMSSPSGAVGWLSSLGVTRIALTLMPFGMALVTLPPWQQAPSQCASIVCSRIWPPRSSRGTIGPRSQRETLAGAGVRWTSVSAFLRQLSIDQCLLC